MTRAAGIRLALGLSLAAAIGFAPAGGAQSPAGGGGADISARVASVLSLTLQQAGAGAITAEVTASIPRTGLAVMASGAPAGSSLLVGTRAVATRRIRSGVPLQLTRWDHAVTRSSLVLRTRLTPASAQRSTVLVITAAPQTP